MSSSASIRRSNVSAAAWQPCVTSDGRTIGDAEWLRRRTDPGSSHTAMLWRCEPMTFDYTFPGDESFLLVSGAVRIELTDSGETLKFEVGDVASFSKGTRSTWTVLKPLVKFTVVSG